MKRKRQGGVTKSVAGSDTSRISADRMEQILLELENSRVRKSTSKNYLQIWRMFNKFIVRLDKKPDSWECRVALFCAYLIEKGNKSTTIKSYISAIKNILVAHIHYVWNDGILLLNTLTRACKLENDHLMQRILIKRGLLELILFELERMFPTSMYNEILYKAIFVMAYYGLMRLCEIASESGEHIVDHAVKARNVHVGVNKEKVLVLLYTSKTHGKDSSPQQIKISASPKYNKLTHFCPLKILREYMRLCGNFVNDNKNFFIFRHKLRISPENIRRTLSTAIKRIGLDASLYGFHSMRAGRVTDLIKFGYSIDFVKRVGRWKSNAVYRYIKC